MTMNPALFLVLVLAGLLLLFFASIPIFASFLICNVVGIYLLVGAPGFGMFVNSMINTATSLPLVAIPLFILMGEILSRASAIDRLMDAVDTLVAGVRGRLYVLTVGVSTILATLTGSAMASAAMLGRTVVPLMVDRGYDRKMALGAAMGGACLAPIIPPSIFAILLGTVAQVSIGDLFTAGIVPGIMIAGMIVLYVLARVRMDPSLAPPEPAAAPRRAGDFGRAFLSLLPFAVVIAFVMGSIVGGFATPSESAALGVVGALGVAAFLRRLSLRLFVESLSASALVTGMIMVIIVSSQLFSQLLAFSGTSAFLAGLVASLDLGAGVMLFVMMAIVFVLAMFLDEVAVMLILVPLFHPLLDPLGFDPIWFYTIFLINLSLGAIAPPVGYVLFILQGVVPGARLTELFRASIPYVVIYILAMVLVGLSPGLVAG